LFLNEASQETVPSEGFFFVRFTNSLALNAMISMPRFQNPGSGERPRELDFTEGWPSVRRNGACYERRCHAENGNPQDLDESCVPDGSMIKSAGPRTKARPPTEEAAVAKYKSRSCV